MFIYNFFCNDKLLNDISGHKICLPGKVKNFGKTYKVFIEEEDLDSIQKIMSILLGHGVSWQEDHDHELSVEEERLLRTY